MMYPPYTGIGTTVQLVKKERAACGERPKCVPRGATQTARACERDYFLPASFLNIAAFEVTAPAAASQAKTSRAFRCNEQGHNGPVDRTEN